MLLYRVEIVELFDKEAGIITSLDTELNSLLPKNEADIGKINPHLKMILKMKFLEVARA